VTSEPELLGAQDSVQSDTCKMQITQGGRQFKSSHTHGFVSLKSASYLLPCMYRAFENKWIVLRGLCCQVVHHLLNSIWPFHTEVEK